MLSILFQILIIIIIIIYPDQETQI
jgi:hypothetical protein